MTLSNARTWILCIFLIALASQIGGAVVLMWQKTIYFDNFSKLLSQVLQIYSLHLSVILSTGFLFQDANSTIKKSGFYIAAALSILWNILLSFGVFQMILIKTTIFNDTIKYIGDVSGYSNFLIAGVLGYLFSSKKHRRLSATN